MASVADVSVRLREVQGSAPARSKAAAIAMGLGFEAAVKSGFSASSPSPPGSPPGVRTGTLRRSVTVRPGPVSGARASAAVGGTVVYARIQELGGMSGPGHATRLPARPYLRPASERLRGSGALARLACTAFTAAGGTR